MSFGVEIWNDQMCNGCSACCMHLGLPPFDGIIGMFDWDDQSDPDWFLMPLWIRLTIIAAHAAGRLDGACVFVEQKYKRCRIYDHRPVICREFKPGCDTCLEDRELLQIGANR